MRTSQRTNGWTDLRAGLKRGVIAGLIVVLALRCSGVVAQTKAITSVTQADSIVSAIGKVLCAATQDTGQVRWSLAFRGKTNGAGWSNYSTTSAHGTLPPFACRPPAPPPPAATLVDLNLSPGSVTLDPGAVQQFVAVAAWSDGGTRPPPPVTWYTNGGAVTTAGFFTAGTVAGSFYVRATVTDGTLGGVGLITVTAPPATLSAIRLTPDSAVVAIAGTQQFNVTGIGTDGSVMLVSPLYVATGGTITAAGLFTASPTSRSDSLGWFRVVATASGKADTTLVWIGPPGPPGCCTFQVVP
jgi:hypothetical protein